MIMKKFRIGMIGAGKIAEVLHIPNVLNSDLAELVAISDPNADRLQYITKKFSLTNVKVFRDYKDIVNGDLVDAVIVAVPNHLHASVSIDALEHGKHVLVEKPMATNSIEANRMVESARKSGKVLMVNLSQRFFPHNQKAREIIQSGMIGEIRLVKAVFGHSGPENWTQNVGWFFDKDKAAFGALGDLGVHKIDLIRYITGLEIEECVALTATLEKNANVEDIANGVMRLSNGALATLDANWITKGLEENYVAIYGENGTLKVGQTDPTKIGLYMVKPIAYHGEIVLKPLFTNEDPYWKLPVADHFIKVCLGLEKPIIRPEDGSISIRIIEKFIESNRLQKVVKIND